METLMHVNHPVFLIVGLVVGALLFGAYSVTNNDATGEEGLSNAVFSLILLGAAALIGGAYAVIHFLLWMFG
jgi:hypothetical protein